MPVLNGGEVARILRSKYNFRGIIVGLTGNMLAEQVSHFMECGLNGILGKPITLSKIKQCIINTL